ncbi:MAG: hypothetical protein V4531_09815 [Actinomycetota bacterium]
MAAWFAPMITLADVARIRRVEEVDVAARIGEVVVSGLAFGNPTIAIPEGAAGASTVPQAFKVTTTYSTNDGLGPRYVTSKSSNVVIDETPRPPTPPPTRSRMFCFPLCHPDAQNPSRAEQVNFSPASESPSARGAIPRNLAGESANESRSLEPCSSNRPS